MILDTLANAPCYASRSPYYSAAFDFSRGVSGQDTVGRLKSTAIACLPTSRNTVPGPLESAQLEVHRKYIDIQYIFSGRETVVCAPLSTMLKESMAYDESNEAALYEIMPDVTQLCMTDGQFAILYPEDAHAPCLAWGVPSDVFKVVVKVTTT